MRARAEDADKMWLLKIFSNKRDAYFAEQYYSIVYSIPQMIFTLRSQKKTILTQEEINLFYNKFDKNSLLQNAISLLISFDKFLDLPFWSKGEKNYNSKLHMFENYACNIFKDYMQMIHFDSTNVVLRKNGNKILPKYKNIDRLSIIQYSGYVYSLSINKFETYIADNILTHNSIYGFQGADRDVFESIKSYKNTTVLPLSYSYRCPKKVVEEANRVFDFVESPDWKEDGEVIDNGSIYDAEAGDFILCRNNAPLIEAFLKLIKRGKKCRIMGRDYGKGLLNVLNKIEDFSNESKNKLLQDKITTLKEKGVDNPYNNQSYQDLVERINILDELHSEYDNIDRLKDLIEGMFSDDSDEGAITLSTIHKSKGLEADNVYFLYPELIPSKYAETVNERYAEQCLRYVAITRSKRRLIYVNNM